MNEEENIVEETSPEPSATPGAGELEERVVSIAETVDHPLLSTPFAEYTVTEGLLLALLISILVICLVRIVKGAFAWLR